MPINFFEIPDSRSGSDSPPSMTLRYKCTGTTDETVAHSYARSISPSSIYTISGNLSRQDIKRDPDGFGQWLFTVTYGSQSKDTGSYTWSFDTTGATVKVKAAKEHIGSYPSGGATNPHKCAIGVDRDGKCDGADIIIPALKLTASFKFPSGVVNLAYVKALAAATGKTNANPFLTFAAGELLLLGATGSDGTNAEAELSYQFAASENVSDLTFGDITGIVKDGHHYAWVEFEDGVDSDSAIVKPKRVHVERVYNSVDYASVLGWGG